MALDAQDCAITSTTVSRASVTPPMVNSATVRFGAVGVAVVTGLAVAANPPVLYGHEHGGHAAAVVSDASQQ